MSQCLVYPGTAAPESIASVGTTVTGLCRAVLGRYVAPGLFTLVHVRVGIDHSHLT